MLSYFLITSVGIVTVLLFDTLGSIASRKFQFSYASLSMVSIVIYLALGYFGALYVNSTAAVSIAGLVGLVDTVLGWQIAKKFEANLGDLTEDIMKEDEVSVSVVIGVVLFSMFTGWLGTFLV